MRPQTLIVGMLALVFGGSSAMIARQYMSRATGSPIATEPVVVAVLDIPPGRPLTAEMVEIKAFPRDSIPYGALRAKEDALDRSPFVALTKGEPLLETRLSAKGQHPFEQKIPPGMRAVSIESPKVPTGVAGFIRPGSKVDVLLTISLSGSSNDFTGGGTTTTLLQNLEVLAVDNKAEVVGEPTKAAADTKRPTATSERLRSVTLLVTPDQAAKLELGQNKGTLQLTLRNPDDDQPALTKPAMVRDLQFYQEEPKPPWDERAKSFLKALGETLAKAPKPQPAPAPAPEVTAAPAPPVPERRLIRTLRGGNNEGAIYVTYPVPAVGSR